MLHLTPREYALPTRRQVLTYSLAAAGILAVGGGAAALIRPVWQQGKLLQEGRVVMAAIARSVLEGALPGEKTALAAAVSELMLRLEATLASLPSATQNDFAQLLALLSHPWSRQLLGMPSDWPRANTAEVSAWLQGMRHSRLALKQQAYHALHDLTFAAWYSDKATWKAIGYELPLSL